MKKLIFLIPVLFISFSVFSQFEHKMSINLSGGGFKTFGPATPENFEDPLQMPNYLPGIMAGGGLQFNINRRISLLLNTGISYSWKWKYIDEGGSNWFEYELYALDDTLELDPIDDGENELKFFNVSIGIVPKFYISPGKKWNPYLFAGININFTHAYYADNYWYDANMYNILPPDYPEPYSPFLENNIGVGFYPGIGIEYCPGPILCYSLEAGYSFIMMKQENFESAHLAENFNAFFLKAGIRFNFLKSKKL